MNNCRWQVVQLTLAHLFSSFTTASNALLNGNASSSCCTRNEKCFNLVVHAFEGDTGDAGSQMKTCEALSEALQIVKVLQV